MATYGSFEELQAWQKARELVNEVYAVSKNGSLARDLPLRNQMRRAAVSVMANIAEGFERGGTAEFVQFLSLAKASVGEVRSHLYLPKTNDMLTSKLSSGSWSWPPEAVV